MSSIVVLTGGGIKGAVAAARCADQGEIVLVHVDYGQPSAQAEHEAVERLAPSLPQARALALQAPPIARPGQAFEGEARASSSRAGDSGPAPGEMIPMVTRGVVPVLLSLGFQVALRVKASTVAIGFSRACDGAHLGLSAADAQADGRAELIQAFNIMADTLAPDGPKVAAALMELTYADTLKLAQRFEVPLEHTWTCVQPGPDPCGLCDPCKARSQAFVNAAMVDPLVSVVGAAS